MLTRSSNPRGSGRLVAATFLMLYLALSIGCAMSSSRTVPPETQAGGPDAGPTAGSIRWLDFSSDEYGFRFQYPESCGVSELDGSFDVGGRIELAVLDSEGLGLPDYVARFVDARTTGGNWWVETTGAGFLGGAEAITIEYRFGGQGRYGTATFALNEGKVYVWGLTAGGFTCDEPDVYGSVLSSFRFTR